MRELPLYRKKGAACAVLGNFGSLRAHARTFYSNTRLALLLRAGAAGPLLGISSSA